MHAKSKATTAIRDDIFDIFGIADINSRLRSVAKRRLQHTKTDRGRLPKPPGAAGLETGVRDNNTIRPRPGAEVHPSEIARSVFTHVGRCMVYVLNVDRSRAVSCGYLSKRVGTTSADVTAATSLLLQAMLTLRSLLFLDLAREGGEPLFGRQVASHTKEFQRRFTKSITGE